MRYHPPKSTELDRRTTNLKRVLIIRHYLVTVRNRGGLAPQWFRAHNPKISGSKSAPNGSLVNWVGTVTDIEDQKVAQLAIIESERLLDHVFAEAQSFMTLLSVPDFRYLKSNAEHEKLIGRTGFIGKTLVEVEPELIGQGFIELLNDVVRTGKPFVGWEVPIKYAPTAISPEERTRYLDFIYQPLRRPTGEVYAIAAQGHDVTDKVFVRKELDEALKETRTLLDASPSFFGLVDAKSQILTVVNDLSLKVIDADSSEVYGKVFHECPWWKPLPESARRIKQAVEAAARGETDEFEISYWSALGGPAGQTRWVQFRATPANTSGGEVEQVAVSGVDITEILRSREQLGFLAKAGAALSSSLDLEETLRAFTSVAVPTLADWCSVQMVQPDGKLKQLAVAHSDPAKVKWAWELHARYPPPDDSPTGPPNVVKTGASELMAVIPEALLKQAATDAEHLRIIEGIGFHSYICVPIKVRGQTIGTITLVTTTESGRFYDERDLRLAEDLCVRAGIAVDNARLYQEAQNLNRLKDEFLATLSHELRTPIDVIQGHADLALSELRATQPSDLRSSLEAIQRNAQLQTQIVADLLDVSSIITGKVTYKPQEASPAEIALATTVAIRPTAQSKGVTVVCEVAQAPGAMFVDPTRLHQILWNLANNAVKFAERGGRVTIDVEKDGDDCVFTVRDTGIGISKDFLPHVFDRFRQADASVSRRFGGLGLGLAIVKNLAELHGGHVTVTSDGVGKGATFCVRLPIRTTFSYSLTATEKVVPHRLVASVPLDTLKSIRVLLVDDAPNNRALVARLLRKYGAEVSAVASANEARKVLEKEPSDIILSDIGMPDESGLEFIRRLRLDERHETIPAIALTAYARPQEIEEVMDAGFQAHVAKPVSAGMLIDTIVRLVARVGGPGRANP